MHHHPITLVRTYVTALAHIIHFHKAIPAYLRRTRFITAFYIAFKERSCRMTYWTIIHAPNCSSLPCTVPIHKTYAWNGGAATNKAALQMAALLRTACYVYYMHIQ